VSCPNAGTISNENVEEKFKSAIESHFDAKLLNYSFLDEDIDSLTDCINACPIDIEVTLDTGISDEKYKVELSQTWLY
jgi:hypothetical protein